MENFKNLFPDDQPKNIKRSKLVRSKEGKWLEVTQQGEERTASGAYNFVVLENTIFARRSSTKVTDIFIGHVDLAQGKDVKYAGKIYFSGRYNRGTIRKWTNESGHYQPDAESMNNAVLEGLPEELFESGRFASLISVSS